MGIYYVTLLMVIVFSYFVEQFTYTDGVGNLTVKRTRAFFVILVALPLCFFAGFRYQVGSDWYFYYPWRQADFVRYLSKDWFEPGWNIIGLVATTVYDRYGSAMLLAAVITIALYIRTIAKYSCNFILSAILFFLLVWEGCFNGVRQYLAAAVLFAGHRFIYERKFFKWLIMVLIATLFHTTAVVMVFWYFVATRELNVKQVLLLVAICIVAYFSYDRIFEFISWYKGKDIDAESDYASRSVNLLRILVAWIPILFYYFLTKLTDQKINDKELNFYANMMLLHALLITVAKNSAYLARVNIYTECFTLLGWPLLMKKLNRPSRRMMVILLLICYGAYWFYDISSHPDVNNFQLWFGK